MSAIHECPNCSLGKMEVFHHANSVPANSCILLPSYAEALAYPRGDIALGFCPECSFVSNVSFDGQLTEYSGRYEETQGFSQTFNRFHRQLAVRLIDRYQLKNKNLLEIGCGKGEFLMLMAELGNNRGVGFDPGYRDERNTSAFASHVEFVPDFYSEKYKSYSADFIICKMTLEHISPTRNFMQMVRRAIGQRLDTIVFFQVPATTRILRDCAFEDIYFEHCSYFTPGSLARLFNDCEFEILAQDSDYNDQYLTIEARPVSATMNPTPAPNDDIALMPNYVANFPNLYQEKMDYWLERVQRNLKQKKRVVLWGSGSKGVSFLVSLGLQSEIEFVVDINPHRQGFYMPGTGQKIVAAEFLQEYKPDLIIVMNSIYKTEIQSHLKEMNLDPEIACL